MPISAASILQGAEVRHPHEKFGLNFQILARLAKGIKPTAAALAATQTMRDSETAAVRELWTYAPDKTAARRAEDLEYAANFQLGLETAARGVSRLRKQFQNALHALMAGVGLLLASVCANVSGLLLARGQQRRSEIAIRLSLGATRGALLRQFLLENAVLAAAGAGLGILAAYAGAPILARWLPPQRGFTSYVIPLALDVRVDWRILLFAMAVSALSILLFGLAPALSVLKRDSAGALKGGHSALP
jgi:ABC-type lipoprotein release transport system permease subunit